MGCWSSKEEPRGRPKAEKTKSQNLKRPKWASDKEMDRQDLQKLREEFWDTQPAYGGAKEVWDALKAVTEDLDSPTSKVILDSAGITYHNNDIRTVYDEKGFKYELPNFILSEPNNLVKSKQAIDESQPETIPGNQRSAELNSENSQ